MQPKHFPLRLAYATTFNRCQGLTLDRAVLDLHISPFTHGQLYTSISRVRHWEYIRSYFHDENEEGLTTNMVYKDLLLSDSDIFNKTWVRLLFHKFNTARSILLLLLFLFLTMIAINT